MAADTRLGARELEMLNDVARIATLDLELRPMMQRITDALAANFGWEFVALVMVDRDQRHFRCEAVTSSIPTDVFPGYSRPIGTGIVGRVAADETLIVLDDVTTDPDYIATAPDIRSEICVPVKHGESLVAVLNLESTLPAAFSRQVGLLLTVANQIAGAIASARLVSELRERARLMQLMSEASRTALAATSLDELLARIVKFISESFAVEVVSFLTFDPESDTFVQRAIIGGSVAVGERRPTATGVVGRCIRERRTQYVPDVSGDADYVVMHDEVKSELAIPILFRDEVLGVLNIESERMDAFAPTQIGVFESVANQVAGAIRLTRLADLLAEKGEALEEANKHLASAIETLHRLSTTDALTDLPNRRRFDETLEQEWRRATRMETPLALLMIDIDAFKPFNDRYGHVAGDAALRNVAAALDDSFHRAGDLVARYGGEEFAVLLPNTDLARATELAEEARRRVEALAVPHVESPHGVVTISIGIASVVPQRGDSSGSLISAADAALYVAKRRGRNRISSVS